MERGHCGVDKMMAMQEVDELERFLEGGIGKIRWLLGFHRGYEGAGGIQVAPRPMKEWQTGKACLWGKIMSLDVRSPLDRRGQLWREEWV